MLVEHPKAPVEKGAQTEQSEAEVLDSRGTRADQGAAWAWGCLVRKFADAKEDLFSHRYKEAQTIRSSLAR